MPPRPPPTPPQLPPPLLPLLLAILFSSFASAAVAPHHYCYPPPSSSSDESPITTTTTSTPPLCPPFRSPPSFPFASSSGCGHPSFQIRCSAANNRSLISINSFSFFLLDHQPDSLLLSPSPSSSSDHRLNYHRSTTSDPSDLDGPCGAAAAALPRRQIDLSGSPFRFSELSCSHLSSIRPCRPELLSLPPNCTGSGGSLTTWQRRLLSRPLLLLKGCDGHNYSSYSHYHHNITADGGGGCRYDVSNPIMDFLRSGVRIEWDARNDPYFSSCTSCQKKFHETAACGFNDSDPTKPFLCLSSQPSPDHLPGHHRNPNRVVLLITALFAFTCFFILAVSAATIFRRSGSSTGDNDRAGGEDPMSAFLRRHHLHLQPPVFTYDQLRASTDGFDPKRKIGDGGFGSVYLAQLDDGRIVAVKRLHRHHPAATTKSFCNEILILSSIQHPNLVRLHGYCCDPRGLLLVYDYVSNGTLADHLHGARSLHKKGSLTWPVRVDVALQTASALEYLHFSVNPPVVHRDITSCNIFVEEDMRIKVGDFGLSRLLSLPDPNSYSSGSSSSEFVCTGPQGTPGYLDPEYHRSFRLTEKSDVYSFGVVLLELVTGMKAVDLRRDRREVSLADMVVSKILVGALHQVVDPFLVHHGQAMGTIEAVAELAFRCVAGDKDDRPDSRELVAELKRIQSRTYGDSKSG